MPNPPFNIIVGSDANYFEGLRVTVGSAVRFLNRGVACEVHVLNCGMSPEQIEVLQADFATHSKGRGADVGLSIVDVDLSKFSNLPRFHSQSRAAYARILAPELLDVDEAVWIDSDCLVLRDLYEMRSYISKDSLVAGVVDVVVETIQNDPIYNRIEKPGDLSYVNSGVLWMNLAQMRQEGFTESVLRFMDENHDVLMYADQGPINALTVGRRSTIPAEYNQLIHETILAEDLLAKLSQGNLHLIGKVKPWFNAERGDLLLQTFCFYRVMEHLQITRINAAAPILNRKPPIFQLDYKIWRSRISGNSRRMYRLKSYRDQLKRRVGLFAQADDLLAKLFDESQPAQA